ncbi:MAG TPA: bifunctional 3-phosphoshikimate 1-carboxyvinyltransferase/cytidylate kinase [Burkholderiaceae bacterium]|nr:bifunctional 3-phosphoshikimate 1-carboxyvinyltransferase/cytidylate kinase [Burkholderiaceae bacterium]
MYSIPFLDLPPMDGASGTLQLPGSKSISNRVLLLAGFCEGRTVVHDLLQSDDTQVMLDALRSLGCRIDAEGDDLRIEGLGQQLGVREADIFLGNSGTSTRSLTAALALLGAAQGGRFQIHGVPRMHERPIGDLVDALRPLGCPIEYLGAEGFPPLLLGDGHAHALNLDAPIRVRGNVSSQFLTGLLQALPLLGGEREVVVEVVGELISRPYVAITLNLLARFGVQVRNEDWQRFVIPGRSRLQSPGEIHVEGDASSASYFVALGAIAAGAEAPVRIQGMGRDSIQGDVRFVDAAAAMGARITAGPNWVEVSRGAWPLKAIELDCNHIPDAAMTLAVMALYADGCTRLTNIGSWRVKETDRIAAMAAECIKLGATVRQGPDWIEVEPPSQWRAATIHTYDDHRIAMCFSLAAFNELAGAQPPTPVRILDPRCVGKTFPDYFEHLFRLAHAPTHRIPVITIDGPTASGKGTLASEVAHRLGWNTLDSGSLYRVTALAALRQNIAGDDPDRLAALTRGLNLEFRGERLCLDGTDVTDQLRLEEVGSMASRIAALPQVREALNDLQLSFRRLPGLVADGRDMGTVIFPDAALKVFLTASAAMRANRRYKQLMDKGIPAKLDDLRLDLERRDERDRNRSVAPLKPAEDAMLLDNSALSIDESVEAVLKWWQQRIPFQGPERPHVG